MRGVWWYATLVLLAGSSFGFVSSIMKTGYEAGFSVQQATDAQYVVGVVVLWLIALLKRGRRAFPRTRRQWLVLATTGVSSAGTSYTYYLALTHLPASLAIVLLFQFAWMVVVIDIAVTRRWPSLQKWIGLMLVLAGTVLAVGLFEQALGHFSPWSVALGLTSGFCYAVTLYMSGYAEDAVSPTIRSALTGTIAMAAIFVAFPPTCLLVPGLWHHLWGWALVSGLFSQVIPLSLMLIAIPHTGGRMAGVLGSIELPVAVFVAWLVLGESVSLLRWIGVILILAGIAVSEWTFPKRKRRWNERLA
ncbi:multidrug transporter [Alicyclobacillus contaminans]|uniref:EamA family transporter n=1 Tax=Alicyclobacillus contaminans TaxID=392016 RepID=UPI00040C7DE7|nr:EamA family transporter [Alicyclobacillus contaminans]GMA50303.1 multidrug transporter [Alicyclobacillus contaminans]